MTDEFSDEMQFFGLSSEIADAPTEHDIVPECYPVWADNVRTLNIFLDLASQWDFVAECDGELSRTRLRWESVEILRRHTNGIPGRAWSGIFSDIRAMERAALLAMGDERNKRRRKREEDRETSASK